MRQSAYRRYLRTLRRVPDRIILAVMGRDLELDKNRSCLCGWFLREKLAEIQNVGASTVKYPEYHGWYRTTDVDSGRGCSEQFGGTHDEWDAIHVGVVLTDPSSGTGGVAPVEAIEAAFVHRVDEAVFGRKGVR